MHLSYTIPIRKQAKIMIGSDFSQQEPKLTAFVSQDQNMISAFQQNKDIYATIASLAFHKPYEECLEFNPETGEYQSDGKSRRNSAKTIVLGITYGRSVPSIGQQLFSHRDDMSDEEKTREAQEVYDAVMRSFPALERLMKQSQAFAKKYGYTETILGRRRHLPDMMLDEFEFKPLPGYVNPEIDPLDLSTLDVKSGIPETRIEALKAEFSKFKYFGQVAKRTKELYEKESIKVVNNRPKINDAKRQCVNCVDKDTEILTYEGWKKYDEINIGDNVISYSIEANELVKDVIEDIHIQTSDKEDLEVWHLYTSAFDAMCTENHRWVMRNFDTDNVRFYETEHILRFHRPRYHILRLAKQHITENIDVKDFDDYKINFYENNIDVKEILQYGPYTAFKIFEYFRDNLASNGCVSFDEEILADKFQLICLMAGEVSNKRKEIVEYKKKPNEEFWKVTCSKKSLNQTARIDLMKKEKEFTNTVWCVTTKQGTWIARRNGKYYITGNSIIQGSAADFTKTALLNVTNDIRWKEVGGEILTVVHDEIVAQVPEDRWEQGAQILKEDMEKAGSFLPFPIKCDVTASYRWYGLELPCKFEKPKELNFEDSNTCSWLQWYLIEMGYDLPIFLNEDGSKPIGDAAHGVSGKYSEELHESILDYCNRYNIHIDEFIDDIQKRVELGCVY